MTVDLCRRFAPVARLPVGAQPSARYSTTVIGGVHWWVKKIISVIDFPQGLKTVSIADSSSTRQAEIPLMITRHDEFKLRDCCTTHLDVPTVESEWSDREWGPNLAEIGIYTVGTSGFHWVESSGFQSGIHSVSKLRAGGIQCAGGRIQHE
ncbi:hypothetical protein FIBSPDRAFT_889478 [Athelia psychrophila]|uniref:Uncharacterized protein n=1 Tax=Athelia psychrophila TaxID=1759441 RepID=A0A166M5B8_9AGAM|nr:hypothetical protein FIBSPDRAFT_889478 [Fibularhizoctonia sp. CBS 109695]